LKEPPSFWIMSLVVAKEALDRKERELSEYKLQYVRGIAWPIGG
jgi:hypothetical protein